MMSKIIIGNQKMYMNRDNILNFIDKLKNVDMNNKNVIICPTFPFIEYYKEVVTVGAQNVSSKDNGAYTGEVSAAQLNSLNISYCIVGHSERREYHNEGDDEINKKVIKLLEQDIVPILCIGEK